MKASELYEKYSNGIVTPELDAYRLFRDLNERLTLEEEHPIPLDPIPFGVIKENIARQYGHAADPAQLHVYTVKQDEKSEKYLPYLGGSQKDILIVIEYDTGYFECNNSLLFLETMIRKGISSEEVEARSQALTEYLLYFYHLDRLTGQRSSNITP